MTCVSTNELASIAAFVEALNELSRQYGMWLDCNSTHVGTESDLFLMLLYLDGDTYYVRLDNS